jgi:hypothetical protein
LAAWLFGGQVTMNGGAAEQKIALPSAVPIYISRTAQLRVNDGKLALRDDPSRRGESGLGR